MSSRAKEERERMISDHAPSDWNIHLTVQYRNPNKQRRSNMVGWRAVVAQLGKGKELSRICPCKQRQREGCKSGEVEKGKRKAEGETRIRCNSWSQRAWRLLRIPHGKKGETHPRNIPTASHVLSPQTLCVD